MQVFFGERWDAPAFDDAKAIPVPVGEECLHCGEHIAVEDSGTMTGYVRADGAGGVAAIHLECFLRSALGSPAHLEGRCWCCTGEEPEDTRSYREQGRWVMDWVRDRKA